MSMLSSQENKMAGHHGGPAQYGVGSQAIIQTARAIPSAIGELERSIAELENTIYSLQAQLRPILDEEAIEKGCGNNVCDVAAPYHYADQISQVSSRIRALNSLGIGLIARLHA